MEATSKELSLESIDVDTSLYSPNVVQSKEKYKNITKILNPSANTVGTLYTAFGGEKVDMLNICNTGTSTSVWVYLVPKDGTAGSTNTLWSNVTIAANESKILLEGFSPSVGYTIQVKSTSGNVCFIMTARQ